MYWNKSLLCLRSLAERCAMCSYIAVFRMATSFTHSNCFCNTLLVMFLNQSQSRALSTTHTAPAKCIQRQTIVWWTQNIANALGRKFMKLPHHSVSHESARTSTFYLY